jgi:hypothetical protein
MGRAGLIGRKSASLVGLSVCRIDRNPVADRFAVIYRTADSLRSSYVPMDKVGPHPPVSGRTVQ